MKLLQSLTDEELVKSYEQGCNQAFEVLLLRHKDRLFGYIFNITRNRDLTDDIFQETFIKVITNIKQGRYVDSGKFFAWMSRIAHNLVIDHYRRTESENTFSNDDNEEYDVLNNAKLYDDNIQDCIVYEETLKDMVKLLDLLPESQRSIVEMRFYKDLSFKKIAELQNISINTALGRMRYAILNLRKLATEKNLLSDFEHIAS